MTHVKKFSLTSIQVSLAVFSFDYDSVAVDDILDSHKYLMKKNMVV